jgi:thiamine-phosphate pyrophosphorylase
MIIAVTNRSLCRDDFVKRVREIAASEPFGVYLREKDLGEGEYEQLVNKIACGRQEYLSRLILCRPESAERTGAKRVQVGIDYIRANPAPPKGLKTGVSVHSLEEGIEAERWGADYITAGHIFETDCKKGKPPRGVLFLQQMCESVTIPVFAIGGINWENMGQVQRAGARGICLMSELMTCENPGERINMYR